MYETLNIEIIIGRHLQLSFHGVTTHHYQQKNYHERAERTPFPYFSKFKYF